MQILTVSGSSREGSSNSKLLEHLELVEPTHSYYRTTLHEELPLFKAELDKNPLLQSVIDWRRQIAQYDSVIFCIPEYIHNMPALIKNGLEWITSSGELSGRPVIPITLTPHAPRGQKAMQSLVWSLQALDANVVVQLSLHSDQINYEPHLSGEGVDMLREAISLL